MRELLVAQTYRCGADVSKVLVNTEENASDDGCDGWTPALASATAESPNAVAMACSCPVAVPIARWERNAHRSSVNEGLG